MEAHALLQLVERDLPDIGLGEAAFATTRHTGLDTRGLGGGGGDAQRAALVPAAINPLSSHDVADPVDAVDKGALGTAHVVHAAVLLEDAHLAGHASRLEAAVAAGRAVPDDVALADDDAQARIGFGQAVRGPEAGQPAAGNGNIELRIAWKRGAWVECLGHAVEPARHLPVALVDCRASRGLGRDGHA